MSIRKRVEEKLAKYLLEQRGLIVHFSFGDPIVNWSDEIPADSSVRRNSIGPNDYHAARCQAEGLYQIMLNSIDFNRLALESYGAWAELTDDDLEREDFGMHAKTTGQAIRLALTTENTFPDWADEIKAERS